MRREQMSNRGTKARGTQKRKASSRTKKKKAKKYVEAMFWRGDWEWKATALSHKEEQGPSKKSGPRRRRGHKKGLVYYLKTQGGKVSEGVPKRSVT